MDISVHEGTYTKEKVVDTFVTKGFMSKVEAERRWNQIVLNPSEASLTYVGYQEILDLEKDYDIYAMVLWHDHRYVQVFRCVVVQAADDPDFTKNVRALFGTAHIFGMSPVTLVPMPIVIAAVIRPYRDIRVTTALLVVSAAAAVWTGYCAPLYERKEGHPRQTEVGAGMPAWARNGIALLVVILVLLAMSMLRVTVAR